jgi:hypothetical protein
VRILFFIDRPGVVRQFAPNLQELARRGHEVRVALNEEPKDDRLELVQRVAAGHSTLTYEQAPERETDDGWAELAWTNRALGDLARYAHPRYEHAPVLRARAFDKAGRRLTKGRGLGPIAQRLVRSSLHRLTTETDAQLSQRYIRRGARVETAIPPSRVITDYICTAQPDVVLATSLTKTGSAQVDFLKSARALRIPTGICVASWDNLSNKGLLKFIPERVFVWNDVQRREAVELHGIPAERVVATGGALFDPWFERRPTRTREQLQRAAGLDPAEPYVVFLGSSPFVTNHSDDEVRFVERWIESLRSHPDPRLERLGVLVRPHPVGKGWRGADLSRFGNAVVWPAKIRHPTAEATRAEFYDSIAHSAAVVGINTTAMIEAAVVGKSVLTVLAPEFAQETTLHFHHLLEQNGGFLHVAASLDEHALQLASVLQNESADAERRREFVRSFVRPHGLDLSPAPIFADAVEELSRLPVVDRESTRDRLLRGALSLETRHARGGRSTSRWRRHVRRLGALLPRSQG